MSSVTVAIIPDRQSQLFSNLSNTIKSSDPAEVRSALQRDVRRPTRGIVLKDNTYATLRVLLSNGLALPLVNAGSRTGEMDGNMMKSKSYSNFLIQQVQEERVEKQQIVETFGEAFIFFFGERPRILGVQGILINTFDFNWEAEWLYNYENYLRGSKCVENDARVYLTYDDTMVSGYIMSTSSVKNSQERNHVPFSFQMFVTDYTNLSRLGDPNANPNAFTDLGETDTSIYRPQLVPTFSTPVGQSPSLFESIANDAVRTIQDTWSKITEITQNSILSANAWLGDPIRVPVGFAGALAFDDPKFVPADVVGVEGPIRFSTFGQNDDEFVGISQQYGSSSLELGDTFTAAFNTKSSFDSQDQMFETARVEWARYGLVVPSSEITKTVGLLSQTGIGLQVLGAARGVVAGSGVMANTALAAGTPVVAGSTALLSNAALADSVVQSTSPETAAAIDRAISASADGTSSGTNQTLTQPGTSKPQVMGVPTAEFQAFASSISTDAMQRRLESLKQSQSQ
jgi:hypothetical protein